MQAHVWLLVRELGNSPLLLSALRSTPLLCNEEPLRSNWIPEKLPLASTAYILS